MPDKSYDDDIRVLDWREHVRIRPGMYFGGVDKRAVHHLLYTVLENALDAATVNLCSNVEIILRSAGDVTISDNSPGLPVENNQLERIINTPVGRSRWTSMGYKISAGGLMGIGSRPLMLPAKTVLLRSRGMAIFGGSSTARASRSQKLNRYAP